MNTSSGGKVHWSFWLIGVVALVWHVMGGINFFMQMNADMVASFPQTHRAIIEGRPVWATGGFAVTVFGGVLGCIMLLLRKPVAYYLFVVSLLGVIVTMVHTSGVALSSSLFSRVDMTIMILTPLAVAAFLIWYAKLAVGKGWLKIKN